MLSRKQFAAVQIARGLTTEEIIARCGIPAQSFMVLMEEQPTGRDAAKLISHTTFIRLADVLGLEPNMAFLRTGGVVEWRVPAKNEKGAWRNAVAQLREELFSDGESIEIAVVSRVRGWFSRGGQSMVFVHSPAPQPGRDIKLAVTGADPKTVQFLLELFGPGCVRKVTLDSGEFDITGKLISNGVYRATQFLIVLGGSSVKYTWADVQASAKEFNFTTDALIELMVDAVRRRNTEQANEISQDSSVDSRPALRVANG